jgi:cytosine/uracil/thiamine/allantoin permease
MKEATFRRTLGFALAMLIVQFLLGTAVNLFVKIPSDHPGAADFSSMLMAVGFALATAAYVALLYPIPAPSTARTGGH